MSDDPEYFNPDLIEYVAKRLAQHDCQDGPVAWTSIWDAYQTEARIALSARRAFKKGVRLD